MSLARSILSRLDKPEYFFHPQALWARIMRPVRPRDRMQVVELSWGLPLEIDAHEQLGNSIWRTGVHDLVTSEALCRLLGRGDELAVDVGAFIGYTASIMAVRVGQHGWVACFEPQSLVLEVLERNVGRWRLMKSISRIEVHKLAVSDREGWGVLVTPSSFVFNRGLSYLAESGGAVAADAISTEIPVVRLDDFFESDTISLLKIDVEGHEFAVLKGCEKMLAERRIRDIVFEDWGTYPTAAMTFLLANDYNLFSISRTFLRPCLLPIEGQSALRDWDSPAYLATCQPERAISLFLPYGWKLFGLRV